MPEPVLARHVLCVLHDDLDALGAQVAGFQGFELDPEFSLTEPDGRMRRSFEASMDLVDPSMEGDDWAAIDAHRAVGYVLSPRMYQEAARVLSAATLELIDRLLAGIAHGARRWRELAALQDIPGQGDRALYRAFVRRPIVDRNLWYTCGMHLLGERDVELVAADGDPADEGELLLWLDAFAQYALMEAAPGALQAGHTFQPSPDRPRRRLAAVPCTRYEPDDLFHNPHGFWRLAGGR
jgi:hypothetical protein